MLTIPYVAHEAELSKHEWRERLLFLTVIVMAVDLAIYAIKEKAKTVNQGEPFYGSVVGAAA